MDLDFFKSTFSKVFQVFSHSLSLQFRLGSTSDFCCFWSFLLQGFSLQTPVRPFYPSFCFYFHISCILIWEFHAMHKLGFLMIQAKFCEIDHWFCYYTVIFMIFVGKFDQFGDLWKIIISRACIEPELGILFNLV